jgi:hypothetical protein
MAIIWRAALRNSIGIADNANHSQQFFGCLGRSCSGRSRAEAAAFGTVAQALKLCDIHTLAMPL